MEHAIKQTDAQDLLLKREVKLHINEQLYSKGYITEEMYKKAKNLILKS